ncbi:hypothetical protein EBZ80_18265 [bacterium]|nr:hypothetical protein [Betaproteobacteria bacterium]NDE16872.1 hypothetical protein [bacterium]
MSTAVIDAPASHATVARLRAAAQAIEQIKNDAPQQFPEAASVGDAVRQGDIYIQKIDDVSATPLLYTRVLQPVFPLQLAEGNTKGSRHCLSHGNGVTVYNPIEPNSREMFSQLAEMRGVSTAEPNWRQTLRDAEWEERRANPGSSTTLLTAQDATAMLAFAGPILRLAEPNVIAHPEHGDWLLPPGTYRITYQRTVAKDNTVIRVWD